MYIIYQRSKWRGGYQVAYSATKGGIIAMVTVMAKDLGHYGIRVNCILPGSVDTPMLQEWFRSRPDQEKARLEVIDEHIIKRLGKPEDIARIALFLCSDEASWITGSTYRVDGGYLVRH
ncbi:MAG: SDR family NAD(P)-dependent oxidoreductase [Nitrososphaerales archaeon]